MVRSRYTSTPRTVADARGVTEQHVRNLCDEGTIPPGAWLRVGRRYRMDLEAVIAALTEHTERHVAANREVRSQPARCADAHSPHRVAPRHKVAWVEPDWSAISN
jgi:hypothetical protein